MYHNSFELMIDIYNEMEFTNRKILTKIYFHITHKDCPYLVRFFVR